MKIKSTSVEIALVVIYVEIFIFMLLYFFKDKNSKFYNYHFTITIPRITIGIMTIILVCCLVILYKNKRELKYSPIYLFATLILLLIAVVFLFIYKNCSETPEGNICLGVGSGIISSSIMTLISAIKELQKNRIMNEIKNRNDMNTPFTKIYQHLVQDKDHNGDDEIIIKALDDYKELIKDIDSNLYNSATKSLGIKGNYVEFMGFLDKWKADIKEKGIPLNQDNIKQSFQTFDKIYLAANRLRLEALDKRFQYYFINSRIF